MNNTGPYVSLSNLFIEYKREKCAQYNKTLTKWEPLQSDGLFFLIDRRVSVIIVPPPPPFTKSLDPPPIQLGKPRM